MSAADASSAVKSDVLLVVVSMMPLLKAMVGRMVVVVVVLGSKSELEVHDLPIHLAAMMLVLLVLLLRCLSTVLLQLVHPSPTTTSTSRRVAELVQVAEFVHPSIPTPIQTPILTRNPSPPHVSQIYPVAHSPRASAP
jgi:uncharacterized membrane protein YoaK (UPF0700 family)